MKSTFKPSLLAATVAIVTGCSHATKEPSQSLFSTELEASIAVTVYVAKDLITMSDEIEDANAVAVQDGKILAIGDKSELVAEYENLPNFTLEMSFANKVITPGLIEPHAHIWLFALVSNTHFITPADWELPWGSVKGVQGQDAYIARLKELDASLPEGEPLVTWGWHSLFHGEMNREILDSVSTERPIIVWQRSVHELIFNSHAIESFNITKESWENDEVAGNYTDWEQGRAWEKGLYIAIPHLFSLVATPEKFAEGITRSHQYLQAGGITTTVDPGMLLPEDLATAMIDILDNSEPMLDYLMIVAGNTFYDHNGNDAQVAFESAEQVINNPRFNTEHTRFLPNQVKLYTDGAAFGQLMQLKDAYTTGHEGEWIQYPQDLEDNMRPFWHNDYTMHIHSNGDYGLEVGVDIVEKMMAEKHRDDHRTTFHHLLITDPTDIQRAEKNGMLFSSNPFYLHVLGEAYGEVGVGKERADVMARGRSFIDAGARLSFHSDAPMAPGRPLTLAWSAVNRTGLSGGVLGAEERLTIQEAMRAITIDAAFQNRLESEVGSIDIGKRANFTIMNQHPYEVEPMAIKDIEIHGTVFNGNVIESSNKARGLVMGGQNQWTLTKLSYYDARHGTGDICDTSHELLRVLNQQ
ncbi:amidohydrolase [Vibrio maerlii]|uniref:amidohydrolase n=1 Tax=Vibrio maerlii TaxID=2231648 RepID=UPI000E3DD152|nr:amidohydrolase family protein [Vibrio maerlii]